MKAEDAPLTGEAHRRVEIGLRLAQARLEEAGAACEDLAGQAKGDVKGDVEHSRLIRQLGSGLAHYRQLVFEVQAIYDSWCKAKELQLRATVLAGRAFGRTS